MDLRYVEMAHMVSSRKRKALTENMYLVRLDYSPARNELDFHISGSQTRVYNIRFIKEKQPSCTCPDATLRQTCCKHIMFVAYRILDMDEDAWVKSRRPIHEVHCSILRKLPHLQVNAPDDLHHRYTEFLKKEGREENEMGTAANIRNDECCICLSPFDDDTTNKNAMTCKRCRNAVHILCWTKWTALNHSSCCVYCRHPLNRKHESESTRDEYGVQLR